jgi:hypothetical protein
MLTRQFTPIQSRVIGLKHEHAVSHALQRNFDGFMQYISSPPRLHLFFDENHKK